MVELECQEQMVQWVQLVTLVEEDKLGNQDKALLEHGVTLVCLDKQTRVTPCSNKALSWFPSLSSSTRVTSWTHWTICSWHSNSTIRSRCSSLTRFTGPSISSFYTIASHAFLSWETCRTK